MDKKRRRTQVIYDVEEFVQWPAMRQSLVQKEEAL